ncbi:uncharacterized protein CBL_12148 [Carabus blaptoides fortunei]
MSNAELQSEEREVLLSIYEGDPLFKQCSPTVFQYMFGERDTIKSFMIELQWGDDYPAEKPTVNMDTFYNRNVVASVKNKVVDLMSSEAEQFLGEAMTYSLIECIKEKFDELMQEQPDTLVQEVGDDLEKVSLSENKEDTVSKKAPKKEQLSKAQKRRQWDRVESKGEKPRGWDWMDVVKHLSQTGSKDTDIPCVIRCTVTQVINS